MNFALWVRVDANIVPAKSPIGIDRVQQTRVVFRGELRDVSPLTTAESLEDDEQDEYEGKPFEEAEA